MVTVLLILPAIEAKVGPMIPEMGMVRLMEFLPALQIPHACRLVRLVDARIGDCRIQKYNVGTSVSGPSSI